MLFYALAALLLIVAAGVLYQAIGRAGDARRFPAPGRLISVGRHRLHIQCAGAGAPAVVLESGIAASALSWSLVKPAIEKFTRVCSYDRAGLGWSDRAGSPRTAIQLVEELRLLLRRASVPGPYVLVGHSFGGLLARHYASIYPHEIAGIVLVDPLDPHEWLPVTAEQQRMLRGGILLSHVGALLAHVGIVRLCLALLSRGRPKGPATFVRMFGPTTRMVLGRIVGEVQKLPRELLPAVQALWSTAKCFHGMADHLKSLPESSAQLNRTERFGDIPLVVLSASTCSRDRIKEHEATAQLSTRGRHLVAPNSGHWIHLDQPELVVNSIRDVVRAATRSLTTETGP